MSERSETEDRVGETRLHLILSDPRFVNPALRYLTLSPGPLTGPVVDCERLVEAFPNLEILNIFGIMGRLDNAGTLNQLRQMRRIDISEVYGMTAADALDPEMLPRISLLQLDSVPADYAAATRRLWKSAAVGGVRVSVTRGRSADWIAQNQANPLRDWQGREGISARSYAKARAAWAAATSPILHALAADVSEPEREALLRQSGSDFARIFNEANLRSGFIETEERDELLDGLASLVGAGPTAPRVDRHRCTNVLLHAVNENRDW